MRHERLWLWGTQYRRRNTKSKSGRVHDPTRARDVNQQQPLAEQSSRDAYRRLVFFAWFNAGVRAGDRANTGLYMLEQTGAARQLANLP